MVSSETGNINMLLPGKSYETVTDKTVVMDNFSDSMKNTSYETIRDMDGVHRYTKRDIGRCTGSQENDPDNIQLGVFWMKYDPNSKYDYIMERKYEI